MQNNFFSVVKSNIKCAICKKQNCPVRYQPERKKVQYIGGSRYITSCEKDRKTYENRILKKKLP